MKTLLPLAGSRLIEPAGCSISRLPRPRQLCLVLLGALSPLLAAVENGVPKDVAALNAKTVWVNPPKSGQLPTGVTHHTFASQAFARDIGYCIYLPPGYETELTRRYPVIYNLHGAGGNELHSFTAVKALHDGIVAGRWPAMIMVLPNGGRNTFYKNSADGKYPAETLIIRELLPFIDAHYRTIASRAGRAIEGFSMGGRGATRLAIKYPELFCSLHNQAGNVMHLLDLYDPAKPTTYPNDYLGADRANFVANDVYSLIKQNVAALKSGLRIAITCGTRDDGHLPTVRDFHAALLAAGIDHTYLEVEGLAHEHDKLVTLYRTTWFDYHAESFRRAAR